MNLDMGGPRPHSKKHTLTGPQGHGLELDLSLVPTRGEEHIAESLTPADEIHLTDASLRDLVERLGPEIGYNMMNLYRRLPEED